MAACSAFPRHECAVSSPRRQCKGRYSGGVEIAVRYITRANERYQMRSRLYQAAMNLISKKDAPEPLVHPRKTRSKAERFCVGLS